MTPEDYEKDAHWERGNRSAFLVMLGHCLRALSYDEAPEVGYARLVYEREQTIAKLREVCDDHGDNDWENSLALPDVIEKHLVRPWEDKLENDAYDRSEEYPDE